VSDVGDDGDKPRILLSDRQSIAVDGDALAELAREVLRGEGAEDVELSVSLVDREEMAELHERYLGEPGPTDVLSFPQDDEPLVDGEPQLLGDVVICPEVAAEQQGPEAEVRLLLVHGILHLLGHDHEEEGERAEMWALQARYSGIAMDAEAGR
jgi:probable rRNA maturation factor